MPERQKDRLKRMIGKAFDLKKDKPQYISGLLGAYKNGVKKVKSLTRPGYVYVRLGGNDSEIIEALNLGVNESFNLKVIVQESETNPGIYVVTGRDLGQYNSWPTTNTGLIKHGASHSFGNGNDPVFIYKQQMVQPLQGHPTNPHSNALRVEGDFYIWNNEIKYFPGGNTTNLTVANPTLSNRARWLTVYLDGENNSLGYVTGTDFTLVTPPFTFVPTGIVYYIPEVAPEIGIPLVSVYLTSGSTIFGWDDIFDVRNFLGGGGSNLSANGLPSAIPFFTGTTSLGTNPRFIFETSGNKLIVGNTGSISGFQAQIQVISTGGQAGVTSITYGGTGTLGPFYGAAYARGSPGAELAVPSGIIIFDISANAWKTGTSPGFISPPPMRITANTLQFWNDQVGYGNYWGFVVTPINSITRKESFRIYSDRVWIDGGEFRTTGTFYVNPIGVVSGQALVYNGNNLWVPGNVAASDGSGSGHDHGVTRSAITSGTSQVLLTDFAQQIEFVSFNGFVVDPTLYSLSSGSDYLLFDNAVQTDGIVTANYVILQA